MKNFPFLNEIEQSAKWTRTKQPHMFLLFSTLHSVTENNQSESSLMH